MNDATRAPAPRSPISVRREALAAFLHARVGWSRIYRATSYMRSALWMVPLVAIVLVLALAPAIRAVDRLHDWRLLGLDVEGARALFQTVITLTLTFMVFTFGSLLVAIQVASGQMTPRIIATTLLRDNVVRYTVGLFVFTLLLSVMALDRLQDHVLQIGVLLIALLGVACMTAFLFLIDYAARLLRPVEVLTRVGNMGLEVIDAVYPMVLGEGADETSVTPARGAPARVLMHYGPSLVLMAVDVATLLYEAQRCDGVIEIVPEVGEFHAYGEPLYLLYGGAAAVQDRKLEAAVAFGAERTLEQDPMFAFRILVDIALKALSPAINDPTTAVLALDQVHRLLRVVGRRRLRGEAIRGPDGAVRVVLRTPNWEDFVHVSCREIRACGANTIQIPRRMAAMLDDLARLLPAHRRPALELERSLLDRSLPALYPLPEDLALARVPDIGGLGGAARARAQNTNLP
jgi:uncharacterized membrane protein